eukprot:gnl/TRDRNA2_/TRDRNA2_84585_c0_seq1.p1 gnl/TRDRNA2_/TRDRNA2_84585_c0~~gnl/TRDRNA2_/TRDRNA2_84585_c0_seq1.p1  ORF type:complete len:417 (-),score=89.51 gnl/TRDRNA2_/TRDRNA2_84585_c0_seq1:55-1143(-)
MAGTGDSSGKDSQVSLSPFDACQQFLSGDATKPLTMSAKLDLAFIDTDLMPLLVQENYLRPCDRLQRSMDVEELEKCAYAAELMAFSDSLGEGQHFASSSSVVMGTIYPAFLCNMPGPAVRPAFPTWLQKRSGMTKAEKTVHELHNKLRSSTTTSSRTLACSIYHDVLYRRLLEPLLRGDVKKVAAMLSSLGLSRDFFTEQAPVFRQPIFGLEDPYKKVDGKAKSQLAEEVKALAVVPAQPVKRKRGPEDGTAPRKKRGAGDDDDDALMEDIPEAEEEGAAKKEAAGKAKAKAKGKKAFDTSTSTLKTWRKKAEPTEGGESTSTAVEGSRPAMLVLKYIEGHTVAVRRKVHLQDIIGPWRGY